MKEKITSHNQKPAIEYALWLPEFQLLRRSKLSIFVEEFPVGPRVLLSASEY
jgi:hypothetical protein